MRLRVEVCLRYPVAMTLYKESRTVTLSIPLFGLGL